MIAPKHIRIPNHIANSVDESDEKCSSIWSWFGGGSNSGNKLNDKIATRI